MTYKHEKETDMEEDYVKIPWHAFYSLMELLDIVVAYIPNMNRQMKDSLRDQLKEIEYGVETLGKKRDKNET